MIGPYQIFVPFVGFCSDESHGLSSSLTIFLALPNSVYSRAVCQSILPAGLMVQVIAPEMAVEKMRGAVG